MDLLTENHGLSWIAIKIFRLLQKEDLYSCRRVCSSWKDCIDSDIHWWRLHIENVYKLVKKTIVPMPYVFRYSHHFHCRSRMLTRAVNLYPDLKSIFKKALRQNMAITKALVPKFKAYNNHNDEVDFTHPIHYAAGAGDIEFMVLLHDHCDADYNEQQKNFCCKCIPLDIACQSNQVKMVEFLFEQIEDEEQFKSAFLIACMASKIQVVEKFVEWALKKGIKLNATNCRGENALHTSTRKNKIKHVELILNHCVELGIDVNAQDSREDTNYTPFHLACAGTLEMVQLYAQHSKDKNIDLNKVDALWNSGFSIACMNGKLEVIDFLLEKSSELNIDLNSEDIIGRTAFMMACEDSRLNLEKVKTFIRHADHIDLDNSRYGILSPALEKKDEKLFQLLLDNASQLGIDINATDNECRSYLHHLCDCSANSPGLACLLLNCEDIDVNVKDSNGKTPLDLARESKNRKLANAILKRQQEDEAKAKELDNCCPEPKRRRKKTDGNDQCN